MTNTYSESRQHEIIKKRLLMIDGNLAVNTCNVDGGRSERVYERGYWGFASAGGGQSEATASRLRDQACANARAMSWFGSRNPLTLPEAAHRGRHVFEGKPERSQKECIDLLADLHAWCRRRYPALKATQLMLMDEHHSKRVQTTTGGDALNSIQRATCYITLTVEDDSGAPIDLTQHISAKGSVADLELSIEALAPDLDRMHEHLQNKRNAVAAIGGQHTVVMGPDLAGILAHEAMGHPCEADIVLGGAVTGDLVGQRVASDLITMVDFAHTYDGQETIVPVYADDEGTPARDAVLIERGILREFMNSRETAARLDLEPTGSARAYLPGDEPLVRMRNTAILPGTSKLDDMIAGVDRGYLLLKTANGQADSTTEFMFAITLGYEIENGRLGRAIRDTTVSGSAIKVLQSVDAISDDMAWSAAGYCGKKQPMVVSFGGPAIRGQAHLGGA